MVNGNVEQTTIEKTKIFTDILNNTVKRNKTEFIPSFAWKNCVLSSPSTF